MEKATFFREAMADSCGPLDGLRVLDLGRVWSAPQACALLGDLGADVIRVELAYGRDGEVPPLIPGTGLSWFRESANRNKRSVGIDLRTDTGRKELLALVATSDVLVENFRPGTLDEWGLGYAGCRVVRPDIIFVSISGWGQYGANCDRAAYDPVIQAAGGWMSLNRAPGGEPTRSPTFLADELAALHAALAALAALRHRDRTGEGQHVDIAMLDALLASSSGLLMLAAAGGSVEPSGNETTFVAPSNVYPCVGGYVYLSVALNRHWRLFAELIGRPELGRQQGYATNEQRLANRAEVNAVVATWCAGRTAPQIEAMLQPAGLVVSAVRTMAEVAADPAMGEREMLCRTELSDGSSAPLTGVAAKFSRTPGRIRRGAPAAGADTVAVLASVSVAGVAPSARGVGSD